MKRVKVSVVIIGIVMLLMWSGGIYKKYSNPTKEKITISKQDIFTMETTHESCFIFEEETQTIIGYMDENNNCPMEIKIPTTIEDIEVQIIGNSAFEEKGLTRVMIPNTVTSIGINAFSSNNIRQGKVIINNHEENVIIGVNAFSNNGTNGNETITARFMNVLTSGNLPAVIREDSYLSEGTYTLNPSGLEIEEGVIVEVEKGSSIIQLPGSAGNKEITIYGDLILKGTETERIIINADIKKITIGESGILEGNYTDINNLYNPEHYNNMNGLPYGDVIINNGILKLEHSKIIQTNSSATYYIKTNGNYEVTNSIIEMKTYIYESERVIIEDNIYTRGIEIKNKPSEEISIKNNEIGSNYYIEVSLSICDEEIFENIIDNTIMNSTNRSKIHLIGEIINNIKLTRQDYIFMDSVTIPEEIVLEVEAGTNIIVRRDISAGIASITVRGELLLNGTEELPITIEGSDNKGWGPLEIKATGEVEGTYTNFLNVTNSAIYNPDAIISYGTIKLDNCNVTRIDNIYVSSYLITSGTLTVEANRIEITNSNIEMKIELRETKKVKIEGNNIAKGIKVLSNPTESLSIKNNITTGGSISTRNNTDNM